MIRIVGMLGAAAIAAHLLLSHGALRSPLTLSPSDEVVATTRGTRLAALPDVVAMLRAAAPGTTITVSAYTLSPRSRLGRAIVAARRSGAVVTLYLDGNGMAGAVRDNEAAAAVFDRDGVQIRMTTYPLHMKAAIVDGRVFVSDRNWASSGGAIILELPSAYRQTVQRALDNDPTTEGAFTTRKSASLDNEAALLSARRSRTVYAESESFGSGNVVFDALLRRARLGDDVTVVVARTEYDHSRREQAALAELASAGATVCVGPASEKIAVDGDAAWVGSSNATHGVPAQVDWGYRALDPSFARTLREHVIRSKASAECMQ